MHIQRRRVAAALAWACLTEPAHAGLSGLLDRLSANSGLLHVILIDDTGSITDADRDLYRQAARQGLALAKPGDRVVVARISDAKLGRFRAALDTTLPNSGKRYEDLANGKKARELVSSTVEQLLVPVAGRNETRIMDVISALEPLMAQASATKRRVRIIAMTDGIEETRDVNMARATLDDTWVRKVLALRRQANLLPKLIDTEVYMVGGGGKTATQAKAIENFWRQYWSEAGAQLKFYGRTVPVF